MYPRPDTWLALLTLVAQSFLLGVGQARTHFPGNFPPPPFVQQNTLSPIGANIDRTESTKDWVKVSAPQERTIRVARGERLELDCEAIGSPAPRLQWFKAARPATQMMEEDNEIRGFGLAKIVRKYIADCALPAHQGTYTCTAVSGAESVISKPTQVIVEDGERGECTASGPKIVLWAPIVMQTMDSDVRIPCKAHGAPGVQWAARDGQLITNVPGSRFKVLDSGDLVILKLKWADMGTYTCFVENELGRDSVSTFLYPMLNED